MARRSSRSRTVLDCLPWEEFGRNSFDQVQNPATRLWLAVLGLAVRDLYGKGRGLRASASWFCLYAVNGELYRSLGVELLDSTRVALVREVLVSRYKLDRVRIVVLLFRVVRELMVKDVTYSIGRPIIRAGGLPALLPVIRRKLVRLGIIRHGYRRSGGQTVHRYDINKNTAQEWYSDATDYLLEFCGHGY